LESGHEGNSAEEKMAFTMEEMRESESFPKIPTARGGI